MQTSSFDNLTWSLRVNGTVNISDPWPELCHGENEMKDAACKKDLPSNGENNRPMTLDEFEYPELGDAVIKSKNCVALRKHCLPSPTFEAVVPIQLGAQFTTKSFRKYNQWEKISINYENAICTNKLNKRVHTLRINLDKTNFGITIPKTLETNPEFRRVKMTCMIMNKRTSKVKRLFKSFKQLNVERREEFERRKKEAICRDVDIINFNALRITPNPEIVRNMRSMTLYDKNYRGLNEIGISDDTVCHRPDMIQKIGDLRIRGGHLANRLIGHSNPSDFLDIDVIENDVVKQTLALKIEDGNKPEIPQITEIDDVNTFKFSRNFRE